MFDNYEELLTVNELMELLYIGRNKAYSLLKNGEIFAVKVGNTYRIPLSAVRDYIGYRPKSSPSRFTI